MSGHRTSFPSRRHRRNSSTDHVREQKITLWVCGWRVINGAKVVRSRLEKVRSLRADRLLRSKEKVVTDSALHLSRVSSAAVEKNLCKRNRE